MIPLFDVGDVVNVEDDPNRVYVVNESILIGDEKNARYMYEVSSVYGDATDDSSYASHPESGRSNSAIWYS